MWTREELKNSAKALIRPNYWKYFAASLLLAVLTGAFTVNYNGEYRGAHISPEPGALHLIPWNIIGFAVAVGTVMWLIGLAVVIFVQGPLRIGVSRFYLTSINGQPDFNRITYGFAKEHYMSSVKTMFLQKLYIFLWSLLFVIPGIVKYYQYYFVSYILADDPTLTTEQALTVSRNLTAGHKLDIFILNLSFIGWYILGALAFGIGTFFVNPYKEATDTMLYLRLKYLALGREQ